MMIDAEAFQSYRPLLFAIAYRMLGSASEAEDVLQDTYLRYAGSGAGIRSLKAYLSTIVTRLCLDRLKSARATREQYIGPWLPEPLLTVDGEADLQRSSEQHESITMAFLVLLETLSPQERAIFLLREVFEYGYDEIAEILGLSASNCRQLFHRAKLHIAERRPRFQPADGAQQQQIVERFLAATQRGDLHALTQLLADDITFWADSGGKVSSARRPVHGARAVARMLAGLQSKAQHLAQQVNLTLQQSIARVNDEPALILGAGGQIHAIFVYAISGGRICAIRAIRNPDKLAYLQRQLDRQAPQQ